MPAARVDNEVEPALIVPVHLDEVVAAPQGPHALRPPEQVHMPGTAQLLQVDPPGKAVGTFFPDGKPGMSPSFGFGYEESEGLDSVTIETYTLNEDGTVTAQIYIPK